jgi:hypothetical protein
MGAALDLGARACGAALAAAEWRSDWRPMTIPAANPSSASNVAKRMPFVLIQNPLFNERMKLHR